MPEVTIVALPEVSDRIRKISSEKEPHLTLLFLGDISEADLQQIIEHVQHTCEFSLRPFGLSGDFRGPLGSDNADVLFFKKDSSNIEVPIMARDYFLKNDAIRKGYNSVEQHPEWTPHLTLGYPESPAKPDKEDALCYSWVSFDRIAVWFKDYAGVEFRLKHPHSYYEEVAMSEAVTNLLEHHGVKGMKWGVRNDKGHEGERATNKKIAKADKKYEKSFSGIKGWVKVQNQMADHINGRLGALNDKYAGQDVSKQGPAQKKYLKDYEKLVDDAAKSATKAFGTNASGTGRIKVSRHGEGYETTWKAEWEEIKHAESSPTLVITPKFNDKGFITSQKIELTGDILEQTDDVAEFLEHFGIKGMKWGVRRSEPSSVEVSARPGNKVTAKGGARQPAHEDAIRVAVSKQKAKASTTDSLSTKELQELVLRMNLEQQYSTLTSKNKKDAFKQLDEGRKKVDTVMNAANTYAKVTAFLDTPAGKMVKNTVGAAVKAKLRK